MTYHYPERSASQWEKNVNLGRSDYDTFIKPEYLQKQFKPSEGHNEIRILPPAPNWFEKGHFGIKLNRHLGIGPHNGAYLCHDAEIMDSLIPGRQPGKCPICKYNEIARKTGNKELSKQLYPKPGILVWLIDRSAMERGPLWWVMPPEKVHREICLRAFDQKRGKAKLIDHPTNGYDVFFEMHKTGDKNQYPSYSGVQLDAESTPMVNDESKVERYLNFISQHSLPTILKYHSIEHIQAQLEGIDLPNKIADDDDDGDAGSTNLKADSAEIPWETAPAPKSSEKAPEQMPSPAKESNATPVNVKVTLDGLDQW